MRRFAAILVVLSAASGAAAAPSDPEPAGKETEPRPLGPRDWKAGEPPPLGYHTEPRYGPIVTGVCVGTLGATTLGLGIYGLARSANSSNGTLGGAIFTVLGGLMVPVGVLLVGIGYDHPRLVRDTRPWVPMVGLGRIGLATTF